MLVRQILTVVSALTALIVVPIAILIAYSITGPFFELAIASEEQAAFGGIVAGDVINFGGAILILGMGVLAIPVALALWFFMTGDSSRVPPSRRYP